MKVAVLGSGNGGCGVAFDWAQHGHQVSLFDFEDFPVNLAAVAAQGGLYSTGQLDGFEKVHYAGHDIGQALDGAELVFAVGPAFAETNTLPYAVRISEPGEIHVYLKLKAGLFVGTLPKSDTEPLHAILEQVYPGIAAADSVFQTTVQNGNPNYSTGYATAPGFRGIRAQRKLDDRYVTEDVGYTMVFLTDLGRQIGVPTPIMDAIIEIASTVLGRDFRGEQRRTMASLGLSDYSVEQLSAI
jgi:hypothetical protein